jgi:hypothetical protein
MFAFVKQNYTNLDGLVDLIVVVLLLERAHAELFHEIARLFAETRSFARLLRFLIISLVE